MPQSDTGRLFHSFLLTTWVYFVIKLV